MVRSTGSLRPAPAPQPIEPGLALDVHRVFGLLSHHNTAGVDRELARLRQAGRADEVAGLLLDVLWRRLRSQVGQQEAEDLVCAGIAWRSGPAPR